MSKTKKVSATFVVTAFRDTEDGPPEVHGKLEAVSDDIEVDIGRRFAIELVPLEEPTPDAEPEGEPIE